MTAIVAPFFQPFKKSVPISAPHVRQPSPDLESLVGGLSAADNEEMLLRIAKTVTAVAFAAALAALFGGRHH